MENIDLKNIKDKYGENMMHLCRSNFATLLDNEGILFHLLSSTFAYSKLLYDDLIRCDKITEFTDYIYSKYKEEYLAITTEELPETLLASVGYKLYECNTREEMDRFRKYYRKDEELCSFAVDRLKTHHVFFIVKDNVDEIKRENYLNPQREDEYSTSVLSIQFTRGLYNHISIKSRYNHSVTNPDSTYFNNLENIVPGLTKSFERKYHLNIMGVYDDNFDLFGYVRARNGLYYKYNYKLNNNYYCPNNIIIDNGYVIDYFMEKEKYLVIDYFIIDLVNKKVFLYDDEIIDSFIDDLDNIVKIEIYNDKDNMEKYIYITKLENCIMICVNKYNQIIRYHNEYINKIGNCFLMHNDSVKEISLPSVRKIGKYFLCYNCVLKRIYAPNLRDIGDNSLILNHGIEELELYNLKDKEFIKRRKKVKYGK